MRANAIEHYEQRDKKCQTTGKIRYCVIHHKSRQSNGLMLAKNCNNGKKTRMHILFEKKNDNM